MRKPTDRNGDESPNGASTAAVLAAGAGCAALGMFELLASSFKGIASFFNFFEPVGPLSGVTVSALAISLATWFTLTNLWAGRTVPAARIGLIALLLMAIGLALTFPRLLFFVLGK